MKNAGSKKFQNSETGQSAQDEDRSKPVATERKSERARNDERSGSDARGPRRQRNQRQRPKDAKTSDVVNKPGRQRDRNADRKTRISVVLPLLNEEGSLRELVEKLENVLGPYTRDSYELIFIDDGSNDDSFATLRGLHKRNHRIRVIRFRRNYGKSAALSVGFERARGEIVITMDADLQDDPEEIPALVSKLKEGFDLVTGWKKKRYDPIHKTLPSKFFNMVTSLMSGIRLHDFNCGLKAYRKDVVKALDVYGEMHRYLPAIAYWLGFRVTEIPVQHHPRKHGVSKFGASRFLKGFLDLLTVVFTTRFIKRPLHLFGTVGTLLGLVGFCIDGYLSIQWLLGHTTLSNRPLALLGVLLIIVGVQFVSLGLIGEMIVKSSMGNDQYLIRDELK